MKNHKPIYYLRWILPTSLIISYIFINSSIGKSSDEASTIYPIDKKQEDCVNKNPTTANMIDCTEKAYEAWGKEVEINYLQLMRELSPTGKELLKASQLEWTKFRDKELKLINHMNQNVSGSMYRVECAQDRVNLVKDRALELKEYLGLNYENH